MGKGEMEKEGTRLDQQLEAGDKSNPFSLDLRPSAVRACTIFTPDLSVQDTGGQSPCAQNDV